MQVSCKITSLPDVYHLPFSRPHAETCTCIAHICTVFYTDVCPSWSSNSNVPNVSNNKRRELFQRRVAKMDMWIEKHPHFTLQKLKFEESHRKVVLSKKLSFNVNGYVIGCGSINVYFSLGSFRNVILTLKLANGPSFRFLQNSSPGTLLFPSSPCRSTERETLGTR